MDLILLQPGDQSIFGGDNTWQTGGSLIDMDWRDNSTMKDLGNFVELISVQQGIKQQMTTNVSDSARTSGRPVITEITCVKYADKISVRMYEWCLRAKPLGAGDKQPTYIYICRNSGDQTSVIMKMSLRDAMISEIQFQSNPDGMPTEQFKLNFTEILWEHTVQNAQSATAGNVQSGWSLARNRPINFFQ